MHRRRCVKGVFDRYLNFIAAPHAHNWAKNGRRIAIGSSWLSLNESVPTGHGFQVDGVSLVRRINQHWDRQIRARRCGIGKTKRRIKDGA